jgi:hypothetical protein
MPTEPANQLWCALPVNMIRRLPGMARASLSRSGQTLWFPQTVFTWVPSGFTVQRPTARHSGLSVYSHRE